MVAVAVVVPTLHAGPPLAACLRALEAQTWRDFETIVVDNSGRGLVDYPGAIRNTVNVGFGAAINQGWRRSQARYIASLNDDAVAHSTWLEKLVAAIESAPDVGMCASQVRLAAGGIDSAAMLIAVDGSSKQNRNAAAPEAALLPSGSAALYRRAMLEEIGGFAEDFFLYCEDTDLGLRARWAGWRCLYVRDALVEHAYSASAGRASSLKAYLVERNRLFTLVRNFPAPAILRALPASVVRYLWHARLAAQGRGAASEHGSPLHLAWIVLKAHLSTMAALPRLLRARRQRKKRIGDDAFLRLLNAYRISLKDVAAQ